MKQRFVSSRKSELLGHIENGTFKTINAFSIAPTTRIFGSRFVDELKKVDSGVLLKSLLVARNYEDEGKTGIVTKVPTVMWSSQRIAFAIAASLPGAKPFLRDISQVYTQSETTLERDVLIKAPAEMDLSPDTVLSAMQPVYGIPE